MNALTNVTATCASLHSVAPENLQLCTPAILYVIIVYVFRTIVLAAVVGRPAYQLVDTVYVRE